MVTRVVDGDLGKIEKGAGQTVLGAVTTIISTVRRDSDEIVKIRNFYHISNQLITNLWTIVRLSLIYKAQLE